MLHLFDFAREMTFLGVGVRMLTAVLCGGMVGLEREFKRRPAGFRTHILICLGASITILTNLYLYQVMHMYTDISRMGAQAIAGIGFIGAGTIIVTKHRRVKGLTTAAGLWAVSVIGLVCGAGYLELALCATAMVLLAELLLSRFEYRFIRKIQDVSLYIEYNGSETIEGIMAALREEDIQATDLEITRIPDENGHHYCAIARIRANRSTLNERLSPRLNAVEGLIRFEEL